MLRKGKQIFVFCFLLIVFSSQASGSDLQLQNFRLFTIDKVQKGEVVYRGDKEYTGDSNGKIKLEVLDFERDINSNTDTLEIECTVFNSEKNSAKNVQVRLAVSPKIGRIVFLDENEGIINWIETESTASWLCPSMLIEQNIREIKGGSAQDVSFSFNLHKMTEGYIDKGLWLTGIILMISIEPQELEKNIKDNTVKITIEIPIGPR